MNRLQVGWVLRAAACVGHEVDEEVDEATNYATRIHRPKWIPAAKECHFRQGVAQVKHPPWIGNWPPGENLIFL